MTDRKRARVVLVPIALPLTLILLLVVVGTTAAVGWISYRAAFHSVEDEGLASLRSSTAARDSALAAAVARKREHLQSTLQSVELGCGITGVMVRPCARDMILSFLRAEHAFGAAMYYGTRQPMRVGSFVGGQESLSGLPSFQLRPNRKAAYFTLTYSDAENGATLAVDFSASGLLAASESLRASTRVVASIGDLPFLLGEADVTPANDALLGNELAGCFTGSEASGVYRRQYIWFHPSRAAADTCIEGVRDQREILAPVARLKGRITRFGIVAGLMALLLAYLVGWLLARPIVRLRQRVRGFRQGDFDSPVPIVGVGEVRELAYTFASMKDSVKAYRETIAENERRLAMVYKAARLWIWEFDLVTGEISWQVPTGGQSHRKKAMRLRTFLRRVHRDDRRVVCDAIRKAKVTGIYEAEYRVRRRRDEPVIWMNSWGQIIGVLRRRMLGVSLDITARKSSEDLIHEMVRLEASAQIAGSLAHEINNPLTAIMAATYMLAQQTLADPAAVRYVDIADKQTRRVAQLVNQILGLYHRPAARLGIDVRSLLEETVAKFKWELDAKRQDVLLHSDPALVHGDREELLQAFSNILQNAIESSPPGSQIRVRAHLAHRWSDDHCLGVRVVIADRGPGIARGDIRKIFEPFIGTKSEPGTGLGLWVTRSAIVNHNGTIRIWSARGKRTGTAVSVFLPIRSRGKKMGSATQAHLPSTPANSGLAG